MTAPNHALTGALIGLTVANPALALPLAFLSHFVCDAIPHYDIAAKDSASRINSWRFLTDYLFVPGALCVLLVVWLALTRPQHWFTAAACAFVATSPDLFWIPRFLHVKRTGEDAPLHNPFLKFHSRIQWKTGPRLIWVEAVWFIAFSALIATKL